MGFANRLRPYCTPHTPPVPLFIGPSLTVPFNDGHLTLGTWQQIVFLDFDNKARRRRIVVQIMGE